MARLLVESSSNDYNPAIELLNKAIEILEEDERTLLKTGRVALSLTDSKTSMLWKRWTFNESNAEGWRKK